jgi:transposase-like protein
MATPRKKPEDRLPNRVPDTEPNEKIAQAVCDNLEIGMPVTLAAEAEGIHRQTVYRWIEQFPVFALRVTRAKAAGAKNLAVRALAGAKGSSMAAWMLERRYREDYGAVTKVITQAEDDFTGRTVQELEGERERLQAKIKAAGDDGHR